MKNLKAFGLLFIAVLIGLTAAVYATNVATTQTVASSKVIVAAVDIELGGKLNPQMLTSVDWPSTSLPPGAFKDIKDVQDRVVMTGVMRGEAILERKLAPPGSQGGLSAVIAQGKRAMTVRVNDVVGVAGFALPGNYVDVMVNAVQDKAKGDDNAQISKTVLSHVLVLAVAQEAGRDDTKPRVVSAVTLELSLEDSEKLDLARSVGTLSLVLRNQVDKQTVVTQGITKHQLLSEPSAPLIKPVSTKSRPVASVASAKTSTACVEVFQNGFMVLKCF
ncbi:MAG: Flp pilus assembly protein CpaB [Polaromonas sp.]|nr:Flp pilus assembly protein CpaB [Polaromonas sp.]